MINFTAYKTMCKSDPDYLKAFDLLNDDLLNARTCRTKELAWECFVERVKYVQHEAKKTVILNEEKETSYYEEHA